VVGDLGGRLKKSGLLREELVFLEFNKSIFYKVDFPIAPMNLKLSVVRYPSFFASNQVFYSAIKNIVIILSKISQNKESRCGSQNFARNLSLVIGNIDMM